ncbi:MAG: DUF861 domain-containing protein [Rhodobacteraceae bacterium]|nr:DUF861 domain-containing protein [Paracoccaceae bacterium]
MNFLHLTEDDAGVSHFSDGEIELRAAEFAPPAPPMPISEPEPCARLIHLILPAGWGGKKHPSPCRQIAYMLSGRAEIVAGDGERREIGPGDIWRMEDVTGSGHTTSVLGDDNVHMAIVQLD